MGLGTACKAETSGMKNISIENSGEKIFTFLVQENCVFIEYIPLIIIIN
jgi:hypothetical protein